jgi:uncharacterized protein YecE (DUF72 family)
MTKAERQLRVGTSGWHFDDWVGNFYPDKTPSHQMLKTYARSFNSVEINKTFYSLPDSKTVREWVTETPGDFLFAVKASRYLTHMKKLKDPGQPLDRLVRTLEPLGDKLGPVLFQLPPRWRVNTERLESFLAQTPGGLKCAFEFRDPSWFCDPVYESLEKHGASLCFYDLQQYRSPQVVTADFVYIRMHGPAKTPYEGAYDGRTLAGLARKCRRWRETGKSVYCFFDNDRKACAPGDANRLLASYQKQAS